MLDYIFITLSDALLGNIYLALGAALLWGVASVVLSPCHLSSIPLIVGFLSSQGKISFKRTLALSGVFAFGILITIAIMGVVTYSLGGLMGDLGSVGNYVVAIVFFIMGLYLMDVIKLSWGGAKMTGTKFKGYPAALVFGLMFGIGLGPCAFAFMAPILGIFLDASTKAPVYAWSLLAMFALGHCAVITLAGAMTSVVQKYLNWTESSKAANYMKKTCGVLVILGGVYFLIKDLI